MPLMPLQEARLLNKIEDLVGQNGQLSNSSHPEELQLYTVWKVFKMLHDGNIRP